MTQRKHLIIDTPNEVLVNLSSGKVTSYGEIKKMSGQKGMTCKLSSLRRLSLFQNETAKSSEFNIAIKKIKRKLEIEQFNVESTLKLVLNGYQDLSLDAKSILKQSFPCQDLSTLTNGEQLICLYNNLLKKYYQTCQVDESSWTPQQGVEGLLNTLRDYGAQIVVGKFGKDFHTSYGISSEFNSPGRIVYGFPKGSYKGDSIEFTHAVIVDQVKKIKDKYFIFFRDPADDTTPGNPESVYVMTYDSFISRLRTLDGTVADNNKNNYTIHSLSPDKLINHSIISAQA